MKITSTCDIAGFGQAIFTDEPYSAAALEQARQGSKLQVIREGRRVTLEIKSVEVALAGNAEFLTFVVSETRGKEVADFIVDCQVELI